MIEKLLFYLCANDGKNEKCEKSLCSNGNGGS